MPAMKLKAPRDATSFSHGGEEYVVKGGYLEIPEILKPVAESHGYGKAAERLDLDRAAIDAVSDVTEVQVAKMGRGELLIYCDEHRMEVPPRTDLAALRKMVWDDVTTQQKILKAASKK